MALNLPSSPTTGTEYLLGPILWVYNGKGWQRASDYQNGLRVFSTVYTLLTPTSTPVVIAYV